jgi:hypothetical protein
VTAALSSDSSCYGADAFRLVESSLGDMIEEIHKELRSDLVLETEMGDLALLGRSFDFCGKTNIIMHTSGINFMGEVKL